MTRISPPVLILILFLLVSDGNAAPMPPSRTLEFREDRSLGVVFVRAWEEGPNRYQYDPEKWRRLGEARGGVAIPNGHVVRLEISRAGASDLSPLRKLPPDSIELLMLLSTGAKDEAMEHIAHLTGLKVLDLRDTGVSDTRLAHLTTLLELEELYAPQAFGDAGAQHVSRLPKLRSLSLWQTKITDHAFEHFAKMPAIEIIEAGYTDLTDRAIERISGSKTIRELGLQKCAITDKGLTHLKSMPNLERLDLIDTHISDAGLAHLVDLPKLKIIALHGNRLGDAALAHLGKIKLLEYINLMSGDFTDEGLSHLSGLENLKELHLLSGKITDEGMAYIGKLAKLEELNFGSEKVGDDGIAKLAPLTNLKWLWLQHCKVGDAGIAQIAKLPSLERLLLNGGEMTWEGLGALADAPKFFDLRAQRLKGKPTLEAIGKLKNLTWLEIEPDREQVFEESELAHLAGLTKLEYLNLDGVPVSNAGLAHLANLTELTNLHIYSTSKNAKVTIDDDGLKSLAGMKKLEYLQIGGNYTDRATEHLWALSSLRYVNLLGGELSDEAWDKLAMKLPSLQSVERARKRDLKMKDPPNVGDEAPDFDVTTIDGKSFKLSDQRGKVVLLYFWGTWCGPCVASTPGLKKLHDELAAKHGERFVMLSLSFSEQEHLARRHAEFHKLTWPQAALGKDLTRPQADYGVTGAPTYFIIGPDGKMASRSSDWNEIRQCVDHVMQPGATR